MTDLAIVIPFYKGEFIKATLSALAAQTDKRFTLYIGDDASPFDLQAELYNFSPGFPVVYHRFAQNLGGKDLVGHWHRSIALSGAEPWIWLLCDDDVLDANCVAKFYEGLKAAHFTDNDIVRFATHVIDDAGVVIAGVYTHPVQERGVDFLMRKYRKQTRSSLSEYVFSRKVFGHFGGFVNLPLAWGTDNLSWALFASKGSIYTINEALVGIRASTINISSLNNNLTAKLQANIKMFRWLKANEKRLGQFPEGFFSMAYFSMESSYLYNQVKFSFKDFLLLYYIKVAYTRCYSPMALFVKCLRLPRLRTLSIDSSF